MQEDDRWLDYRPSDAEIAELTVLLEQRVEDERNLQTFLSQRPSLIVDLMPTRGGQQPLVIPNFALGSDYVTDFATVAHRSFDAWDVALIEIEPAFTNRPLFDRRGNSSGRLLGAERQIKQWQEWVRHNEQTLIQSLRKRLRKAKTWEAQPELYTSEDDPLIDYLIVAGRRTHYVEYPSYRSDFRANHGNRITIRTWDGVVDAMIARQ